jgi:two-component system copper resistance phosphate regulon response regulator CusR
VRFLLSTARRRARSIDGVHILVVEDEVAIADFLERGLRAEGYSVTAVHDGEASLEPGMIERSDLVILDVMLPGRDGLEVLREIRARAPSLPVLMLTARGSVGDKVAGLDGGAIDYLTKPFSFEELTARVRAHLRRPDASEPTTLEAAGIRLDLLTRQVTRDSSPVQLSAKEFELLAYFLRHPDQVLSRGRLLSAVWGYEFEPETNVVAVYVGYLRRKLALPDRPAPLETLRSAGYRLVVRG